VIFLSAGELWAAVIGLAAAMGAAWYLLGLAASFAASRLRKARALTAVPSAPSPQPSAQAPLTMIVHPCGCIFSFTRAGCEPCPHHAEADRDRAEINRLDQQIRQMP
jgi:hypothetical protein